MRLSTRFVAQDVMWQAAPVCELAIEGSFEQARIAYAVRTAIVLDLVGMVMLGGALVLARAASTPAARDQEPSDNARKNTR